ncbi:MAG TPA: PDZ domain-containing protein [Polyangiaceae bacterium]|jgi:predicted metalloprotease with PDZ domain
MADLVRCSTMKNKAEQENEWTDNCEGIPLIGLLPDSPAEQAGMQPGDVIVAVNGMRTQNVVDYISAKRLCKLAMQVVFVRGHAYYEATMHWHGHSHAPSADLVARGHATKIADRGLESLARGSAQPPQLS